MSRIHALIQLGLTGEDFGPCYADEWTHEEFSEMWRGDVPCPTEAQINAAKLAYANRAPEVPKAVTMRQARLALLGAGLLETVNTAVANMTGAAGQAARIEWEYSGEVQRDKALVQALAPVLGLNDAQLDALFINAAAL